MEKEMATHSSILAWEILWTEAPGKELDTTEQLNNKQQSLTSWSPIREYNSQSFGQSVSPESILLIELQVR